MDSAEINSYQFALDVAKGRFRVHSRAFLSNSTDVYELSQHVIIEYCNHVSISRRDLRVDLKKLIANVFMHRINELVQAESSESYDTLPTTILSD